MKILWIFLLCYHRCQANPRRISWTPVRGGGNDSVYEINPRYVPPPRIQHHLEPHGPWPQHPPATLVGQGIEDWSKGSGVSPGWTSLVAARKQSPSLFFTVVASLVVFVLWQMPPLQPLLRDYFVLSRANLRRRRLPCLLLSSVSHTGLLHLLGNLLVLVSFGPPVRRVLTAGLWPLLLGAALSGSAAFLLLDRGHSGGSLGLSDVVFAVVAVYARMFPRQPLTVAVAGLLPVRLEARRLLLYLLVSSALGVTVQARSPIAHSAHLGGLLFGLAFFEVWSRQRLTGRWPWPRR